MDTDQLEQLQKDWQERSDAQVAEALARPEDYDEDARRIIRAEAMKRSQTCPTCGLASSLNTMVCDCGHSFGKPPTDPENKEIAPPRNKAAGCLWSLGGYFCFVGTKELGRAISRNDVGGAVACFFFPILFFGIAGVMELRSSWHGELKAKHGLAFAPALFFVAVAAFFAVMLNSRQHDKEALLPFAEQLAAGRQAREQKYTAEIAEIGFEEILSPTFAAADARSGFKESFRRIDAMLRTQRAFNDEQLAAMMDAERQVDKMDVSGAAKGGLQKKLPQVRDMQNKSFALASDLCSKAKEMIVLLRDNAKHWKVKEDTFMFDNDRLQSEYQTLADQFNKLAEQQGQLVQDFAAERQKAEDTLRE